MIEMQKIKYTTKQYFIKYFNLIVSIQCLSQKLWVSLKYEKSKLDEDWETFNNNYK